MVRRPEVHLQGPADRQADVRRRALSTSTTSRPRRCRRSSCSAAHGVPGDLPERGQGHPRQPQGRRPLLPPGRPDRPAPRTPTRSARRRQFELARYVVHYADGKTADVPVYSEVDVDDYKQQRPGPLPGAQIAWTRPYEGTDQTAVAYSKQWNNPRPAEPIAGVDLLPGADKAGTPALLALTAAPPRPVGATPASPGRRRARASRSAGSVGATPASPGRRRRGPRPNRAAPVGATPASPGRRHGAAGDARPP